MNLIVCGNREAFWPPLEKKLPMPLCQRSTRNHSAAQASSYSQTLLNMPFSYKFFQIFSHLPWQLNKDHGRRRVFTLKGVRGSNFAAYWQSSCCFKALIILPDYYVAWCDACLKRRDDWFITESLVWPGFTSVATSFCLSCLISLKSILRNLVKTLYLFQLIAYNYQSVNSMYMCLYV